MRKIMEMKELKLQDRCKALLRKYNILSYLTQWPPRGTPDMMVFPPATDGRPVIVEFKTKEGRIAPLQRAVHKQYEAAGYRVHIVRSFEQFKEVIYGSVGGGKAESTDS